MKRLFLVMVLVAVSSVAAFADVTVTTTISINAAAMNAEGTMTSYAKAGKFRVDTSLANQNMTLLSDAATKQQWMINHVTKQIEPFDPSKAMGGMPITLGDAKASVKANGQTKEVLGRICQGYDVEVTVPMTIGGETVVMKMAGPAWVAKDGAGVAEYRAAQKAFADQGMSTSMLAQGPQAKGMMELSKQLGEAGLVMEQQNTMSIEGTGQMAQMMGQAAGMIMTVKVSSITTDAIPDSKFALPEGYSKK